MQAHGPPSPLLKDQRSLKKNQNASRPSEHPPVRGGGLSLFLLSLFGGGVRGINDVNKKHIFYSFFLLFNKSEIFNSSTPFQVQIF